MVFGPRILQHTLALSKGQFDYLERLPRRLLLRIMTYLDLEDIARLGRTSRSLRKVTLIIINNNKLYLYSTFHTKQCSSKCLTANKLHAQ